ncbi:hypothetical protein K373_01038 [Streptomyces sp. DvalAA-21]|nr:hypothetical protein K373_01038 [Streptomyces sp. DvalAA-21]RAJ39420.1 hypothetical protein K351_01062 [Streptomyces sp. DpondAA-E10]SCE29697.1 hypothetical protein GA0115235_116570 [Streptomyces sp. DpondAA-F4a]SCM10371.1 hypothetical protein SAMN04883147_107770 [Streptomyces sp. DpondAA-F4]
MGGVPTRTAPPGLRNRAGLTSGRAGRLRVPPRPSRRRAPRAQEAVQAPTAGAEVLPFVMTVNPKLVEAPAARVPL